MAKKTKDPDLQSVIGKQIARVLLRPFSNGRGGVAYNPLIVLRDGTEIWFQVCETETDYGVTPKIRKSQAGKAPRDFGPLHAGLKHNSHSETQP